jgi:hypothetical protein
MLRKALVSDTVRSFMYCVRTGTAFQPAVILGNRVPQHSTDYLPDAALAPFATSAYSRTLNYLLANRQIILLASWLRSFSTEERNYAIYLHRKYYGSGNCIVSLVEYEDQSHFC